jgi:hypothetical protein
MLGASQCGCGARFVGAPLDEEPIKVKRFGPTITAILLLAVVVIATLVFTKWLAVAVIIPIRYAWRAMHLSRRDPEWYGGFRAAAATLALAVAGTVFAAGYFVANIPTFLENRQVRRNASTQANVYHIANLLEDYKRTYGSYPKNDREIKKAIAESLPSDYWGHSIKYQSYTDGIADGSISRTGIPFNNYELLSAGPDGKEGTDDDIIMRDGIFYTNAEVKRQPTIRTSSDR